MKISIIVPIYNKEKYLKRCIDSILRQTYKNIELILVDDGSTDSSLKICKRYKEDERVKLITQKNQGVSKARNVGIDCATGNKIVFVDADDYIADDYIEMLSNNSCGYDMVLGGYCTVMGNKITKNPAYNYEVREADKLSTLFEQKYVKILVTPYLKIFEKKIIVSNNICFDETMDYGEDTKFVIDYLNNCSKVRLCDYCGYYNCIYENTLSRKYIDNLKTQYDKITSAIKKIPNIDSKILDYWNFRGVKLLLRNDCYKNLRALKCGIEEVRLLSFNTEWFSMSDKIIYNMIKCRMYVLLYLLFRWRQR